jgi:hypothetical protein
MAANRSWWEWLIDQLKDLFPDPLRIVKGLGGKVAQLFTRKPAGLD